MRFKKHFILLTFLIQSLLQTGCNTNNTETHHAKSTQWTPLEVEFATGFKLFKNNTDFRLDIFDQEQLKQRFYFSENSTEDSIIAIPTKRLIVTSTTHITPLDELNQLDNLIGFPQTNFISNPNAIDRINSGAIAEIGSSQQINIEKVLQLKPDLVMSFNIHGENNQTKLLTDYNIPVLYNGDWTERHPLGKAEWIKVFGLITGEIDLSFHQFMAIKKEYNRLKALVENKTDNPLVISGSVYKDQWFIPGGKSWSAQFITDAGGQYLWGDNERTESLSISIEQVIQQAMHSDIWIAPGQFTSYRDLVAVHPLIQQLQPVKDQKVFTYSLTRGANEGVLFFEEATSKPHWVLKDLIRIFHPDVMEKHRPYFFKNLNP
ncbi:MAG: ABC transporter substrate-binding protein, partial [Flavobacteriaceae bacterium]|nr:ABC transporter substrate-binding protein [Flavobacteriaceae bacterium]